MTDTTPHDADDELLSAHLDGELAPDEAALLAARLEAEPALRARLGALRAAAAAVGAGVPAAPARARERAVAEALLAAGGRDEPVVDLAARRRRRDRVALSAAAVVLLAVLAVPLLRSGGGDEDAGTMAAGPDESAQDEEAGATAAQEEVAADNDGSGGAGVGPPMGVELGLVGTPEEVATAVADALRAAEATGDADVTIEDGAMHSAPREESGVVRCETPARAAVPDSRGLVLSGFATYGGNEAYVLAFDTPRGREAVVVGAVACDVLAGPVAVPG